MMRPVRRAIVTAIAALIVVAWPSAGLGAAPDPLAPTTTQAAPTPPKPILTRKQAREVGFTSQRLGRWLRDHPATADAPTHDPATNLWTVSFTDEQGVRQAEVLVDDATSTVRETRTGPQVAWQMARGYKGAFGRSVTEWYVWLPLLAAFLIPLVRWRRLLSWHTLDLIALCSFSASLYWFTRGEIFTSVPLAYPPLAYLVIRLMAIGLRGAPRTAAADVSLRAPRRTSLPRMDSWCPTWVLFGLMLLALGLRVGLNIFDSNVVDIGYAGVIGADRIVDGQTIYGTFPSDCGQCDTYGPFNYLAYVPFEIVFPWIGTWNDLPAAHAAASFFDLATLAGLLLLGWRIGGRRLAAGLGLAWTAFPFTAYALESNSNDSLVSACLVWGLVVAHRPMGRGIAVGLAALAKFTPAILLILWARHPFPKARPRRRLPAYIAGLALTAAGTGWVLFLDGLDGVRKFWSRTMSYQFGRESPFSIWGQYEWLRPVQLGIAGLVGVIAIVAAVRPRRFEMRSFCALSAALLAGIQLTMTHWFYLYLPWFLPLAIVALIPVWPTVAPRADESAAEAAEAAVAGDPTGEAVTLDGVAAATPLAGPSVRPSGTWSHS